MKVLVTGATSGLGRNAAEWLLTRGIEVRATGRDMRAGEQLQALGSEFVPCDLALASEDACRQLVRGCDWVWHCAAKSSPWGAWDDFASANPGATERLTMAAGREGISRFVHISTPAIYFDFRHHHQVPEEYRARHFAGHYARSKFLAEAAVQRAVTSFPECRFAVLRPRGLFGPHDRVILPRVLEQIRLNAGTLRLPGAGQVMLDITFVENVVHAMHQASTIPLRESGRAFNITNEQPMRLVDMLDQLIRQRMGIPFTVRDVPWPLLSVIGRVFETLGQWQNREPRLTRYSVGTLSFDMTLSTRRASTELGYRPVVPMADAMDVTARWFRHHSRLQQD